MINFSERYARHLTLPDFGEAAQQKLKESSVLLIGVGGLGSAISLYLTAAGVGKITLVDGDVVSVSNLQRQVLYSEKQIDTPKVLSAKKRLTELNSEVEIVANQDLFTSENAVSLVGSHDIVIDGMDNYTGRYLLNDVCVGLGKPFVYGSIGDYWGQVAVFNHKNGATYRCLYPDEDLLKANCLALPGVLGVLPGVIGCLEASEAIKLITGCGDVLNEKLFVLNLQNMQSQLLRINRSEEEYQKALKNFAKIKKRSVKV